MTFGAIDSDYRIIPPLLSFNKTVQYNQQTVTENKGVPPPPMPPPPLTKVNELFEIQKHMLENCSKSPPEQLTRTPLASPPKLPDLLSPTQQTPAADTGSFQSPAPKATKRSPSKYIIPFLIL